MGVNLKSLDRSISFGIPLEVRKLVRGHGGGRYHSRTGRQNTVIKPRGNNRTGRIKGVGDGRVSGRKGAWRGITRPVKMQYGNLLL